MAIRVDFYLIVKIIARITWRQGQGLLALKLCLACTAIQVDSMVPIKGVCMGYIILHDLLKGGAAAGHHRSLSHSALDCE